MLQKLVISFLLCCFAPLSFAKVDIPSKSKLEGLPEEQLIKDHIMSSSCEVAFKGNQSDRNVIAGITKYRVRTDGWCGAGALLPSSFSQQVFIQWCSANEGELISDFHETVISEQINKNRNDGFSSISYKTNLCKISGKNYLWLFPTSTETHHFIFQKENFTDYYIFVVNENAVSKFLQEYQIKKEEFEKKMLINVKKFQKNSECLKQKRHESISRINIGKRLFNGYLVLQKKSNLIEIQTNSGSKIWIPIEELDNNNLFNVNLCP